MSEKEAFIAGFMASAEGRNGEFVKVGRPRDDAEKLYKNWSENNE